MAAEKTQLGDLTPDSYVTGGNLRLPAEVMPGQEHVSAISLDLTGPEAVVRWHNETLPLQRALPGAASRWLVRTTDLVISSIALVFCAPLLLGLAIAVRLGGPGPVVYGSERIAYGGGTFRAWKFRTMVQDADEVLRQLIISDPSIADEYRRHHKLIDDPRVTGIGRVLRRLSLDELPQLANVFRGQMSIVGPRPKLVSEGDLYGETLSTVLRVKPGLTGLWQTSGRNDLSFDERIILDVKYATSRSLRLDLKLMLLTGAQLLSRNNHGAY